ncbi:hypothetical protein CP532_1198 [Ophiocordyceps camponoti-leonardi (nom. inval.)]|nr:hypothetical protein CP532_1198 [Ophiocordyceps camponoti-leonardi (nom. inval.)]
MSNLLDSSLQGRAATLHAGASALDRQERDVARATDGLRDQRQRLAREADGAARRLKELGNVQNWAEVLERGFLVVEETLRLVRDGEEEGSGCSFSGDEDYDDDEDDDDEDDDGRHSACSDASRSFVDPDSSMGAKGSDDATSFFSAESSPEAGVRLRGIGGGGGDDGDQEPIIPGSVISTVSTT